MQRISRNEFQTRFGRRPGAIALRDLYDRDLYVDRDAVISGWVEGSLYIRGGSQALLTGIVQGSVYVGREAVLWVEGTVEGSVIVDGGAAFLNGTCSARGDRSAVVYDPSEPPGSETERAS